MNIKDYLISKADINYQKFSASLIPNITNVLGVRLPILRKIAKEIYQNENWKEILTLQRSEFMEETMLQGMIIGLIQEPPKTVFQYIKNFVPKINNWSVCDSFCCSLKFVRENKNLVWNFLLPYFNSEKEFELRFAYVMMLNYFIDEIYIDKLFKIIDKFNNNKYYSQMAVAWALSICYIKFPQKTKNYLKISKLDNFTYNKAIQKICDSHKIGANDKKILKTFYKH